MSSSSGGYDVYPFAVCRIGGMSFDVLDVLCFPRSREQQELLARRREELRAARQDLEEGLRRAVGEADDDARRRALLRAARNLRRNHKLSEAQQAELAASAAASELLAWQQSSELVAAAEEERETVYAQELGKSRRALRSLARQEPFLQGLVLASPTLYRSFLASLRRPLEEIPYNRAQRRLELGLVKYLSRAAAKTTPFSTFTPTVPVTFDAASSDPALVLPDGAATRSSVHLSKGVYALLHRLFAETPELYPSFAVTLNPSLYPSEQGYEMLLARDGREQTVSLGRSPALERSVELIREAGGTLPYGELVDLLADEFGVQSEDLRPRLDRMAASGFLELNTGIPDAEPRWTARLAERLADSTHPLAQTVHRFLVAAQGAVLAYAEASAAERADLLERLGQEIEGLLRAVALTGDAAAPEEGEAPDDAPAGVVEQHLRMLRQSPLYEDTSLAAPAHVDRGRLQPVCAALGRWVERMSAMSLRHGLHANLRGYYEHRFAGREEVPFPVFYRGFFGEVYEEILHAEQGRSQKSLPEVMNPFGLDLIPRAFRTTDELFSVLRTLWAAAPESESLHLGSEHLDVSGSWPPRGVPVSATVFAQLLPASFLGRDALVFDKPLVLPGRGKYFSRFLDQYDSVFTHDLRAHNTRHPGFLVAELADDGEFSFNANLHPPLTDHEIGYPARLTGLEAERNLELSELVVRPHPSQRYRLRLVHRPSGKEVLPSDLGFLTPTHRPPLFRVLGLFSGLFHHRLQLPWTYEAGVRPSDGEVLYRPRLLFDGCVVVSRRAWRVPAKVLQELLRGATPAAAFDRLDAWRRGLGMPEHVFFHSQPQETPPKDDAPQDGEAQRTQTHKPQYLDFQSGVLAELLTETLREHRGVLTFEEMLPAPHMLSRRDGKPHVTELVLQLDR